MPDRLITAFVEELKGTRRMHEADLAAGGGAVWLPHALARKWPNARGAGSSCFPRQAEQLIHEPASCTGTI